MQTPSKQSLFALDSLNVFLADVRDGIGPYLSIYLLATRHWSPTDIGIAMSAMGAATLVVQTPAGALIDKTKYKRVLMAIASAMIAVSTVLTTVFTSLWAIVFAQVLCGIGAAFLGPGLAAITLGLVGRKKLARQTGRNESFNHAGNVVAAASAGALGYFLGREWIFYLVALMALLSLASILFIRESEIDLDLARGCPAKREGKNDARRGDDGDEDADDGEETSQGLLALLKEKRILGFISAMLLFHFANAAMLPLVGQRLSSGKGDGAALYMSACIIIAQLVMIPVATFAGRYADSWGRRPVFLIALLALPLRGLLYTLSDNSIYLVSVQALDGIGAGIFGVVSVLIVADLTRGTGRYNLASSALATAVGIGASLSNVFAGYMVAKEGYSETFLSLATIAAIAAIVFYLCVPETAKARTGVKGYKPKSKSDRLGRLSLGKATTE